MSFIKVLSYSQKKEFESPPLLSDEARRELFTIPVSMELQLASRAPLITPLGVS
jgi:hypothetical protein